MATQELNNSIEQIRELVGEDVFKSIKAQLDDLIRFKCEKRKRNKHQIPLNERCLAKKSGGEQCTRRKKDVSKFCGTHIKGTPHGQTTDVSNNLKKVNVFAEDIDGIIYYIDDNENVYNSEDVFKKTDNPRVILKYKKDETGKILLVN
jgi:hypothetical protein